MKVVLITGASSGIGYVSARIMAQKGFKVYGGARRTERMEPLKEFGVVPLALDVTSEESAKAAIDAVVKAEGRIDVLVNNAGYGSYGPIENTPLSEAQKQLDVNVLGLARMTQMVLPYMRAQKSGLIVNISSIGGRVTTYFGGWYHASKYAVEALSDATRMEVGQFGINVSIIEPAGIASEWGNITADHLEAAGKGTAYESETTPMAEVFRRNYSKTGLVVGDTSMVTKKIMKAANSRRPKPRYHAGHGAGLLIGLHALLPARAFDWFMKTMMKMV